MEDQAMLQQTSYLPTHTMQIFLQLLLLISLQVLKQICRYNLFLGSRWRLFQELQSWTRATFHDRLYSHMIHGHICCMVSKAHDGQPVSVAYMKFGDERPCSQIYILDISPPVATPDSNDLMT
jgi:hypothetical protein